MARTAVDDTLLIYPNHPNYFNGVSITVRRHDSMYVKVRLTDDEDSSEHIMKMGDMIYLNDGTWVISKIHYDRLDEDVTFVSRTKTKEVAVLRKFGTI